MDFLFLAHQGHSPFCALHLIEEFFSTFMSSTCTDLTLYIQSPLCLQTQCHSYLVTLTYESTQDWLFRESPAQTVGLFTASSAQTLGLTVHSITCSGCRTVHCITSLGCRTIDRYQTGVNWHHSYFPISLVVTRPRILQTASDDDSLPTFPHVYFESD